MSAYNYPPTISRNTVAEIKGSTYPEQVRVWPDGDFVYGSHYKKRVRDSAIISPYN
jgi:hypothetical protein